MSDDKFVRTLFNSGIPHAELDHAFEVGSFSRLNKLLAKYWQKPQVAQELSKILGGKNIRNDKFKRIKPMYQRLSSLS